MKVRATRKPSAQALAGKAAVRRAHCYSVHSEACGILAGRYAMAASSAWIAPRLTKSSTPERQTRKIANAPIALKPKARMIMPVGARGEQAGAPAMIARNPPALFQIDDHRMHVRLEGEAEPGHQLGAAWQTPTPLERKARLPGDAALDVRASVVGAAIGQRHSLARAATAYSLFLGCGTDKAGHRAG